MQAPAFGYEAIAQFPGSLPAFLSSAGVEPDFQRWFCGLVERVYDLIDRAIVPPDRWRHHGEPGEVIWKPKTQYQCGQPAERGTAEPRECCFPLGPVLSVDKRLQLLDQKTPVTAQRSLAFHRLARVQARRCRRIFVNTILSRVGHSDDDDWFDQLRRRQTLGSFIRSPFDPRERSRRVENILAVVEIEHWIAPDH